MLNKILLTDAQSLALQNYQCLEELKQIPFETAQQKYKYELLRSLCVDNELLLTPALLAFISLALCSSLDAIQNYVILLTEVARVEKTKHLNMFIFSQYLILKV